MLYAAIEGGGTKFLCAVFDAARRVVTEMQVATGTPEETLGACARFFLPWREEIAAVGIASFGPLEPRAENPRYGRILATPKPGWSGTDLRAPLRAAGFEVPIVVDTDVNGAVLAEWMWGAGQGCVDMVYFTVGTGIGGGALVNGRLVHGSRHSEMGHMRVERAAADAEFGGICPFHGACLEGLASGPAVLARWGRPGQELPPEHPAWDLEAEYLAQMLQNTLAVLSPERMVLGGGVCSQPGLLEKTREALRRKLGEYWPEFDAESQVLASGLDGRAGLLGALALAMGAD